MSLWLEFRWAMNLSSSSTPWCQKNRISSLLSQWASNTELGAAPFRSTMTPWSNLLEASKDKWPLAPFIALSGPSWARSCCNFLAFLLLIITKAATIHQWDPLYVACAENNTLDGWRKAISPSTQFGFVVTKCAIRCDGPISGVLPGEESRPLISNNKGEIIMYNK